jgi:hypothetical protein
MDADELEDYLELQDPKVKRDIAKSSQEFRAGKGRSIDKLIADFRPHKESREIPVSSVANNANVSYRDESPL